MHNVQDLALHHRYAEWLFQETGFDLRGQAFTDLYAADRAGASSVEVGGCHLDIRIWQPRQAGTRGAQTLTSAARVAQSERPVSRPHASSPYL